MEIPYFYTKDFTKINLDIDCSYCRFFTTKAITYPSGICQNERQEIKGVGIGMTCSLFESREKKEDKRELLSFEEIDFDNVKPGDKLNVKLEDIARVINELEKRKHQNKENE